MCVIIDTCALHSVFGQDTVNHEDFKPVFDWLIHKNGKMIYGGTKYKEEFEQSMGKYRKLLSILESAGKIIKLDDATVDKIQSDVEKLETDADFDDPHLLAIVIASGCKVVCTNERRAIKYLKKINLFPCSKLRPKIYRGKRNINLTMDKKYISTICK